MGWQVSLLQNSGQNSRDGARPSKNQPIRLVFTIGGTTSVSSVFVLQETQVYAISKQVMKGVQKSC